MPNVAWTRLGSLHESFTIISTNNLHLHVPFTSKGIRLFPLSSASVLNLKRNTKQCSYNSSITGVSTSNLTHLYLLLVSSSISAGTALSNTNQAPTPAPPPPPSLTSHPTLHYFSNYYESNEPYILHKQFQYETRVSALTLTSSLLHTSGTTHILCQLRSWFSTKGVHCLGPVCQVFQECRQCGLRFLPGETIWSNHYHSCTI